MKQVDESRMWLRVKYSQETDLIFSDNIPAYADWLEKRLAAIEYPKNSCSEEWHLLSLNMGDGVCSKCGISLFGLNFKK